MGGIFKRRVCGAPGLRPTALLQWRRTVALAVGAIGALVGPAAAVDVPDEGFVHITTLAEDNKQGTPRGLADPKDMTLPAGDPTKIESFVQMSRGPFFPGGSRFPTNPSNQPEGFYSAVMSGNRIGAVGASGRAVGLPSGSAIATYVEAVTNHGAATRVPLSWHIPSIEVGVLAYDYSAPGRDPEIPSDSSPRALAGATLTFERLNAAKVKISQGVVFDYSVELEKWKWDNSDSSYQWVESDDLDFREFIPARFDVLFTDPTGFGNDQRAHGLVYAEFSGASSIAIGAGETLVFTYLMGAVIGEPNPVIDDIVMGLYAQVGDPFNIGSISDGGFTIGALLPVPEPPSVLLLVGGGMALVIWRRRARARLDA